MVDQIQVTELQNSLEEWKDVIVSSKRILLWEKQWHGTAILGANTVIFTLLWLIEPGILPILSVTGLLITIFDFILLNFRPHNPSKWTPMNEKEFEDICKSLIYYKTNFQSLLSSYYNLKTTNKKMYYGGTIASLIILAYIGATINNYFLLYITLTILTLTPGVKHNQMLDKWWVLFNKSFRQLVDRIKNGKLIENKKSD